MENLLAVYTAKEVRPDSPKPVLVSGWSWLKKESQAIERCKKKLSGPTSQLTHVWVCDWKQSPSAYKQILGDDKSEPMLDMAAHLRSQHLKKQLAITLTPRKQIALQLQSPKKPAESKAGPWSLIKAKAA